METLLHSFFTYVGIGIVITAFVCDWSALAEQMREEADEGKLDLFSYALGIIKWIFLWPIVLIMALF